MKHFVNKNAPNLTPVNSSNFFGILQSVHSETLISVTLLSKYTNKHHSLPNHNKTELGNCYQNKNKRSNIKKVLENDQFINNSLLMII